MPSIPLLPRPSAILWDMDGTLIDQTAAIIRAYIDVIESMSHRMALGRGSKGILGIFMRLEFRGLSRTVLPQVHRDLSRCLPRWWTRLIRAQYGYQWRPVMI